MVEFAVILPALMILVFGMIEFSILLYDKAVITNASREGARFAAAYVNTTLVSKTEADIDQRVLDYASKYLITFGTDTLVANDITVKRYKNSVNGEWVREITVEYQYDFLVFPKLVTSITGPIKLSGITIMRDEDQSES